MGEYITKNIVLEPVDYQAVMDYAKEKGLDNQRGFSAAVRGIIREWIELNGADGHTIKDEGDGNQS